VICVSMHEATQVIILCGEKEGTTAVHSVYAQLIILVNISQLCFTTLSLLCIANYSACNTELAFTCLYLDYNDHCVIYSSSGQDRPACMHCLMVMCDIHRKEIFSWHKGINS